MPVDEAGTLGIFVHKERTVGGCQGDTLFDRAVNPDAILFVESTDSKAKDDKIEAGEAKIFEIKELPPPIAERLNADYILVFHKLNAAEMDGRKINAYFLETLMRIKPGGGLRQPDVKTFLHLAQCLGPSWKRQQYLALDVRTDGLLAGLVRQSRLTVETEPDGTPTLVLSHETMQEAVADVRQLANNVRHLRTAETAD